MNLEMICIIVGIGIIAFLELFFIAMAKVAHDSEIRYLEIVEAQFGEKPIADK